jgi:hypothetical protein
LQQEREWNDLLLFSVMLTILLVVIRSHRRRARMRFHCFQQKAVGLISTWYIPASPGFQPVGTRNAKSACDEREYLILRAHILIFGQSVEMWTLKRLSERMCECHARVNPWVWAVVPVPVVRRRKRSGRMTVRVRASQRIKNHRNRRRNE